MAGKGGYREGSGRPKGVPNKVTSKAREALQQLIDEHSENLGKWITEVAAEDPARALEIFAKLAEYTMPKLARTETTLETKDKKIFEVKIKK
jgi:hypothetical protein